jgi:hypothetical protein
VALDVVVVALDVVVVALVVVVVPLVVVVVVGLEPDPANADCKIGT